jgi:hypothetical protein
LKFIKNRLLRLVMMMIWVMIRMLIWIFDF